MDLVKCLTLVPLLHQRFPIYWFICGGQPHHWYRLLHIDFIPLFCFVLFFLLFFKMGKILIHGSTLICWTPPCSAALSLSITFRAELSAVVWLVIRSVGRTPTTAVGWLLLFLLCSWYLKCTRNWAGTGCHWPIAIIAQPHSGPIRWWALLFIDALWRNGDVYVYCHKRIVIVYWKHSYTRWL